MVHSMRTRSRKAPKYRSRELPALLGPSYNGYPWTDWWGHVRSWAWQHTMVNLLDRFEQSFERLVEGSVGRLFRSPIQPAEIGRKLERAMVSNQVTSVDSTLVPNDYRVAMHPLDMVLFVDFVPALCRQMESWLQDAAEERGFTIIDRMRVQIIGEESVPRRAIQVTAAIADKPNVGRA